MEKRDNMTNLNFGRIEYLRTKSGRLQFTSKAFSSLSSMRCAELFHDDRLRCRELPCSWVVTTVFVAMKPIFKAIKTVVAAEGWQIDEKRIVLPCKKRNSGCSADWVSKCEIIFYLQ